MHAGIPGHDEVALHLPHAGMHGHHAFHPDASCRGGPVYSEDASRGGPIWMHGQGEGGWGDAPHVGLWQRHPQVLRCRTVKNRPLYNVLYLGILTVSRDRGCILD